MQWSGIDWSGPLYIAVFCGGVGSWSQAGGAEVMMGAESVKGVAANEEITMCFETLLTITLLTSHI